MVKEEPSRLDQCSASYRQLCIRSSCLYEDPNPLLSNLFTNFTLHLVIPEGLPIALTTSLTIVANMMRKNKILCKSLKTVETLGSVSVICSDKTGTLTKNKMVVTDIYAGGEEYTADAARDTIAVHRSQSNLAALSKPKDNIINQVRILGGLCNSGEFDAATMHLPIAERKINGDATDQAVLRLSETLGSVAELRRDYKKVFEIAFNSKNKFMVRLVTPANQTPTSNNA
jgi:sodium/potassium-transporting ATPase subunit alpha